MMLLLFLLQIIPFEKTDENILKKYSSDVVVSASGSIGQWYNKKCNPTHPEHMVDDVTRKTDWCSNINKTKTDYPWLGVNLKSKSMKLTGYSIRSGCCYYDCCCYDDRRMECCCWLYSWSLQGSHDNKTWKVIHKVEKDDKFYYCVNRSYKVETTEAYEYVRLIQDNPWPGCNYCICLNKLELYGDVTGASYAYSDDIDSDETVSIIGKVKSGN